MLEKMEMPETNEIKYLEEEWERPYLQVIIKRKKLTISSIPVFVAYSVGFRSQCVRVRFKELALRAIALICARVRITSLA